jgi:hypothetical protein
LTLGGPPTDFKTGSLASLVGTIEDECILRTLTYSSQSHQAMTSEGKVSIISAGRKDSQISGGQVKGVPQSM